MWFALVLLLPASAQDRTDCDSLLALRIAREAQAVFLPDCDTTPVTAPLPGFAFCTNKTANACAQDLWFDADVLPLLTTGNGALTQRFTPRCRDGSGQCAVEDEVRCVDGSRPMYWVDDVGATDWIIHFRGGAKCFNNVSALDFSFRPVGEDCRTRYFDPGPELTRSTMTGILQPDRVVGEGVTDPAGPFAAYNRVEIHKCAFDGYRGDRTIPNAGTATGERYDVHFHGRRVVEAVFNDLGIGPADDVILSGHSGAVNGVIRNVDWVADTFTPNDTRAIIGNQFKPGPYIEWDCADTDCTGANAYNPNAGFFGTSAWSAVDTYDNRAFLLPGGREAISAFTYASSPLDTSCEAAHPGPDVWICLSLTHVLMNHVTSPIFVLTSLEDSAWLAPGDEASVVGWDQNAGPYAHWDAAHMVPREIAQIESFAFDGVDAGQREEPFDTSLTSEPLGYFFIDSTVHALHNHVDNWWDTACVTDGQQDLNVLDAVLDWVAGNSVRIIEGQGGWSDSNSCVP